MSNQLDEVIDFRQFFSKVLRHWVYFAFSLFFLLLVAFAYNRYSHELYFSETSILIKEENDMSNAFDLLYQKKGKVIQKTLENKELMLKSFPLINKTLKELRFDIEYYIVGNIMVTESFYAPIVLECNNTSEISGKSISIEIIDNKRYSLVDNKTNEKSKHNFGEDVLYNNVKINVLLNLNGKY